MLSVYDGDKITAEDAWKHYRQGLGLDSVGVLSVTVAECEAQNTIAQPDPTPFPEHAVIDFSELTNSQGKKAAKQLRRLAEQRGWKYGPVSS